MKIALVTTGGYYYSWPLKDHFYTWLREFAQSYRQDADVFVMSWRPHKDVPEDVRRSIPVIYRNNVGCDWGCYNDFVKVLRRDIGTVLGGAGDNGVHDGSGIPLSLSSSLCRIVGSREKYDVIVFCHDDIQVFNPNWPIELAEHLRMNKQFMLSSFYGDVIGNDPVVIDQALNPSWYLKGFMSMAFAMRANDDFYDKCPFVTLPGNDVKTVGNSGCMLVSLNVWNTWGSPAVGWAAYEGDNGRKNLIGSVGCWKRGSVMRSIPGNEWPSFVNPPKLDVSQIRNQGLLK